MVSFGLCLQCKARFGERGVVYGVKDPSRCHICSGVLSGAQALAKSAIAQSQEFEWNSFSVSSSFQKAALIREEKVADYFVPGEYTSLKNSANRELSAMISSATGRIPDSKNPDALFFFDFISSNARVEPAPVFVFGHYLKLSRGHCQSRWHCHLCGGKGCGSCKGTGSNYPSVEEELGRPLAKAFGAGGFTLHASGREDVDVRALGTGRPFVMTLRRPSKRSIDLRNLESFLSKNPSVRAVGLRMAGKNFADALCASHFDKEYSTLVSADRPLGTQDAEKIASLSGTVLFQQTPRRVLSRRTDMVRKRKIIAISARQEPSGKLRISVLAEAGTYIKELISSDSGRTKPSVSEILGCSAVCDELDLVAVRDSFLGTIRTDYSKPRK